MANKQTIASKKYHEKIGVKLKSFQLPIELIEEFKGYCDKNNISQSKQIKELMTACMNNIEIGNNLSYEKGYEDCDIKYKERDKKLLGAYNPVYEKEILLHRVDFVEITNKMIDDKKLREQVIKNLFGYNVKTPRKNIIVIMLNDYFKVITESKYKEIYSLDDINDYDSKYALIDHLSRFYIDLAIQDTIKVKVLI